jgi:hypothetical protein
MPPTLDEVALEMSNRIHEPKIEAEVFINHYEANGWMVGKNKMKSWKHAVSNWINRSNNFRQNNNQPNQQKSNYKVI